MTEPQTPPRDDLYRAMPGGVTSSDGKTLTVRLAPANQWAEINSRTEGHFMERFSPSAYRKTMAEHLPKIIFQHGQDPQVGEKPIATTETAGEDEVSPFARGQILDGVPELVVSGLREGVYGASHRFNVVRETFLRSGEQGYVGGPQNPDGLPERTITEARLFELGPVTWPAYAGASVALRSITDEMRGPTSTTTNGEGAVITVTESEAPSLDAEADAPHLEPERRDEPVVAIQHEERPVSDQFVTRDEKSARVTEIRRELETLATSHEGVLPDDEQVRWDAFTAEHDRLEADIKAWDARQARLMEFAGKPAHIDAEAPTFIRKASPEDLHDLGKIASETRTREEYTTRVRENALRAIDTARFPAKANVDGLRHVVEENDEHEEDGKREQGEIARRILLTGAPAYRRAFGRYLRGERDLWSPEEARAAALAVVGTTTTGGYAVPYIFDPTMIHLGVYTAENPFRAACRTETITNGNNWRTVTVGAITSAYATEALAASEGGPTFGQPTYTVQRAQAFATVSIETLEDRPDISSELTSVFAESKATLEENEFAVGSGATVHPFGMFTTLAYTNVDTATNDVTAIADLLVLEGALPLRFRARGAFFMNRSTLRQLMALDTTYRFFSGAGIQYAGQNQPNGNGGGNTGISCLGYPVWEVPSAVSTLTTDNAIIVVFCDPKSYIIVDRIGMNVEVIPNMLNGATPSFPTGQRGIYAYWRNTAKPVEADAGRSLSVA